MHNPTVLTYDQLQTATQIEILRSIYELLVGSISLFFALIVFYIVWKTALWFLPHYWYRNVTSEEKK